MTMTRQPSNPRSQEDTHTRSTHRTPRSTVDGVSVRLGGREVLHHAPVSFSIKPGEFVGLIGSNGAGKTTPPRVILGLLPAGSGKVTALSTAGVGDAEIKLDPSTPAAGQDLVGLGGQGQRARPLDSVPVAGAPEAGGQ